MKNETSNSQTFYGADAWNTEDAPDKYFAYVPESAKGPDGNKSERKLPLASVAKKDYDEAIVRNALARFPQTDLPASAKAEVLAKIKRVARDLGIEVSDEEGEGAKGGTQTMSEKDANTNPPPDKTKELEAENQRLQGELAKRDQRIEILERGSPIKSYQAEIDRLKKDFDAINEKWLAKQAEERAAKVRQLVDARVRAGLIEDRDRATEAKKYETLQAEALDSMIQDFEVIATQVASGGPKAKFFAQKSDNTLEEAVERRLFGSVTSKEEK